MARTVFFYRQVRAPRISRETILVCPRTDVGKIHIATTTNTTKKEGMKKILLAVSALALSFAVTQQANAGGVTGSNGGYYYFTYYTGSGTTSISFPVGGGNFVGTWTSGVTDSLCGKGWSPGSTRTIGYNCGQLSGSWHSAGAYFWAPYPNRECYITEFGANSGTSYGTINSDGGTYTVYLQVVSSTFQQYKDDRTSDQSKGANHSITESNHINKWTSLGWSFGSYNNGNVFMCEAFSGPGTANATVW